MTEAATTYGAKAWQRAEPYLPHLVGFFVLMDAARDYERPRAMANATDERETIDAVCAAYPRNRVYVLKIKWGRLVVRQPQPGSDF